jgi:hypothetical protein
MPGLAISTEIISHRYDTRNTFLCCYMNVTLYFVLRMILRIVVLLCTNGAAMQFSDAKMIQKMGKSSESNQKCLFGDDSGDFTVPGHRNRTDVLSNDEVDKFRNINRTLKSEGR